MSYNVFGGTLNLAPSINQFWHHCDVPAVLMPFVSVLTHLMILLVEHHDGYCMLAVDRGFHGDQRKFVGQVFTTL